MDTISLIIVTAFLNAIITGIIANLIFYRYQKKIEDTFARSMLEYQTKFVRNHEKTVETLDTVYKKFAEFESSFSKILLI